MHIRIVSYYQFAALIMVGSCQAALHFWPPSTRIQTGAAPPRQRERLQLQLGLKRIFTVGVSSLKQAGAARRVTLQKNPNIFV